MSTLKINETNKLNDDGACENLLPVKTPKETDDTTNGKLKAFEDAITFSEALERTNYGKFNYIIIIISGLVLANVLLETSAVAFYMPVAHCDLQLTNTRKGFLSAIGYLGMIVSSHLWGFLADTRGRRRVIRPTLIAGFVVTVISSFATNFWSMLVLRLINGIFVSGASATIYAYISEFHTDRTRSKVMMISSFIFAIGAMFMPFISFSVINREWRLDLSFIGLVYKPWRLFVIVCGIPGLVCGIAMYFLPESPKFLLSMNKEEETKEVLQQMYRMNGGKDKLEIPHLLSEEDNSEVVVTKDKGSYSIFSFLATMWNQTVPLFKRKYLRSTLIVCTTQFWLYVITNGLYMWFPYIVNAMGEFMKNHPGQNRHLCMIVYDKHDKVDNSTIADCPDKLENTTYMYSLLMEILYVSTFAIITLIINRVSKLVIMVTMIIFCSSCGLAAVWIPYTSVSAILYVVLFLVGISINVLGAATVDLYPTQLRAMAMCVSLMMGRIGSVVGTNIVGALVANYCEMTFYISCFAMLSCALLILFLPRSISSEKTQSTPENA
ncbi:synaptic vesicle glycoprotein 2B-like isoform X1 [Haematobia irritans]|uniref:synaptic vesicle glycoprotein 2B-like isoform X1 n=1 Tax=Haematobia irritans TaxID=7368 RepID=UPI003F500B96